jgi:hypothetical protein
MASIPRENFPVAEWARKAAALGQEVAKVAINPYNSAEK